MKFGNFFLFTFVALFLVACGSVKPANTPILPTVSDSDTSSPILSDIVSDTELEIIQTSKFLPKQEINELGEVIPYEFMINPYFQSPNKASSREKNQFQLAKDAMESNRWDEAKLILEELIRNNKRLSGPWMKLAEIDQLVAGGDLVLEYLGNAIKANPNNVYAYLELAKKTRIEGKFEEAQNIYAKLLTVWKDFPEAHYNLAVHYDLYLNMPKEAKEHFQAYLFLSNDESDKVKGWIEEIDNRPNASLLPN